MSISLPIAVRNTLSISSGVQRRTIGQVDASVEVIAFWSGIALPAVYLPLLTSGLRDLTEFGIIVGLIALHLVALIVGHEHRIEQ